MFNDFFLLIICYARLLRGTDVGAQNKWSKGGQRGIPGIPLDQYAPALSLTKAQCMQYMVSITFIMLIFYRVRKFKRICANRGLYGQ